MGEKAPAVTPEVTPEKTTDKVGNLSGGEEHCQVPGKPVKESQS